MGGGDRPNGRQEAPDIRHLTAASGSGHHASFRSTPRSASKVAAGIHPHGSDGFLSQASFPGAVTPDWHGESAQAVGATGPADVRQRAMSPAMTTVTASYRRDAFAAQAGAATSARVRKRAYVRLL